METRYAVLIGINDYDNQPLNFCVNDALSIKNALVERANFIEKNIYSITSDPDNSVKDITGKLFETVSAIKNTFQEENDSVFFYFAGHGSQENNESYLVFHDSKYPIRDIYTAFKELKAKMQFYVIDACESGNRTITRSVFYEKDNYLNELIKNSSGILFLYACQADQYAQENEAVKHGVMTHYFIEAIRNDALYDEEGILTPGRIQEYVAKKVATFSHFSQTPVSESNTSGYYPFAMKTPAFDSFSLVPAVVSPQNRAIASIKPTRESRLELQKIAIDFLTNAFNKFIDEHFGDYQKSQFDTLQDVPLSNTGKLKEVIVSDATGKHYAINKTIYYKEKPVYKTITHKNMLSFLYTASEQEISHYEDVPVIDYNNAYFDSIDIILVNDDIWKVSFGIGAVAYQAKWGGVISPYFYKIEWDGEKNSIIDNIKKYHYTYLIESTSREEIPEIKIEMFADIRSSLASWNNARKEELDAFKIISTKKES
jgi:uncharacterized caspase-like protein